MNNAKLPLALLLTAFLGLHAFGLYADGVRGFLAIFEHGNVWTLLLGCDLVIALGLTVAWMARDAKGRGVSIVPYVLMMIATGSAGTLLYLIRRKARA